MVYNHINQIRLMSKERRERMSELNTELVSRQNSFNMQNMSTVYNGGQMSKSELMAYLYEVTKYKKEFESYELRKKEREKQLQNLEVQTQCRRTFPVEYKMPPSGLERFSSKKKMEYQRWLDDTPKREAKRQQQEKEEDERIAMLKKQYSELQSEALNDVARMNGLAKKFEELMLCHVIAPDYRGGDIPQMLLMYLFNGRANTLAEAINIYHEEMYRLEMKAIAEQQRKDAYIARQRQLDLAWNQLELQREQAQQLATIAKASEETKDAVKNVEFWTWLDYIS